MSMEQLTYIIGGVFGLFLCFQYVIFYITLARNSRILGIKPELLFIASVGFTIFLFALFSLLKTYTSDSVLQSVYFKIRYGTSIITLVSYILLMRSILISVKDMTFVETDDYKETTKKYIYLLLGLSAAFILIFLVTPWFISASPLKLNMLSLGFPVFLIGIGSLEIFEFTRIMRVEKGKISHINSRRFYSILWMGTILLAVGVLETILLIFKGTDVLQNVGSLYMYCTSLVSIGLSLNLLFEYMEVMSRMQESNKKLSDLNKKIMDEVRTAQSLQISLLPIDKQREIQKKIDMEISYMPMQSVGGDYYDFYSLDKDQILMLIGDASGHGVYAAMIWAMLKVEVEELIEEKAFKDLADAFSLLNMRITRILENTYSYATLFSCIINRKKNALTFISAGHTDQLYFSREQDSVLHIRNKNPIIGTFKNAQYSSDTITSQDGDVLLLFTDGVPEGVNPQGEQLEHTRLQDMFLEACHAGDTASDILNNMLSELEEYSEGALQHDDRTIMVVRL